MRPNKSKAAVTVRPRMFAFIALLGALAAVLGAFSATQALATPPAVKLEVNQNCVDPDWPCWTAETSALRPQPALKVTIASGGTVMFVEHDSSTAASVVWTGGPATPSCPGVPTTTTAIMNWEGTCTFATPGTYNFESSTMFNDTNTPYGDANYTKYEVVVSRPPGTPKAETKPATAEHQTEATLTGSIEPEGNSIEYHFEYGSGSVSEHSSALTSLSASDFTSHSVSLPVSDLSPGTEYHFELVVSYGSSQTVSGGPQAFKTPLATEPTVSTLAASAPKETEATLNGKVDAEGGTQAEYFFEWGAGSGGSYEHATTAVSLPSDGSEHQAFATVTGLTPGGEYHFRLVAKNALGSVQGQNLTFMAASTPPTKEPETKEPSPTPTTPIVSRITTSMQAPAPSQSLTTAPPAISTAQTKPLTRAQKLAKALKECKKQPKKKRAKCEAKAKTLYGPKHKSHKK